MISVIVPVYNVEAYLKRCVDSVLGQTYTDFELILVDDGSPDNCPAICDEYAQKDSRIKVIHQQNGGLSAARNAGLDIATGDYVCFLDGDDHVKENLLETVIPHLNSGMQLVAFNYYFVRKEKLESSTLQHGQYSIHTDEERLNFIVEKLCRYAIGWEACTRIFDKKIIDKYKLRFADNRKIFAEDLYFSLCYILHIELYKHYT